MVTQNITYGWQYSFTASNASSIPVVNIPSSITTVLLTFYSTFSSTSNYTPTLQFSSNNGTSYITSGYASAMYYYGTSNASGISSTGVITVPSALTNQMISGYMYIIGLNTTGSPGGYGTASRADNYGSSFAGTLTASTNANAFQIINQGGAGGITGTFKAYGLN